jgi:hypothetical protein
MREVFRRIKEVAVALALGFVLLWALILWGDPEDAES